MTSCVEEKKFRQSRVRPQLGPPTQLFYHLTTCAENSVYRTRLITSEVRAWHRVSVNKHFII